MPVLVLKFVILISQALFNVACHVEKIRKPGDKARFNNYVDLSKIVNVMSHIILCQTVCVQLVKSYTILVGWALSISHQQGGRVSLIYWSS